MGDYFDGLVDKLKDFEHRRTPLHTFEMDLGLENPPRYLEHLVRDSSLFELPFSSTEIFSRFKGDKAAFCDALGGYMGLSQQHGRFFITPFPLTAIEDDESVVFLDYQGGATFRTTSLRWEKKRRSLAHSDTAKGSKYPAKNILFSGDVTIREIENTGPENIGVRMAIAPLYFHMGAPDKIDVPAHERETLPQDMIRDLSRATMMGMEQIVYIMDPRNFIIRLETNAYRTTQERLAKRGKANTKLSKTVDRPVYRVLSRKELLNLGAQSSLDGVCFHPVEGYPRTLRSDVFKNMKGQTIYIPQHFKGEGTFAAEKGGLNYEVYIKLSPVNIVPFSQYAPTRK